jgi:AAA domain
MGLFDGAKDQARPQDDDLDGLDDEYAADAAQATPTGSALAFKYTLLRDLKLNLDSQYVVKGLIPRCGIGAVYAAPGDGKTAIVVDLALHIASGLEYRARRVERQPVVYVALEGHGGIANRLIAAAQHLGVEDAPLALVMITESFRDPASAKRTAAVARELVAEFGGDCPVVVIDTFTAALGPGGSDCRPEDVSEFIEAVKAQLVGQGYTVLIVHHTGKDASRGARGWSGLLAALDFELEVSRDDELRVMRVTKMRDGADLQCGFCYRLEARDLGANPHGERVTAVVVKHLADEATAEKGSRLSAKARAALNVLWEMIKDRSRSFPLPENNRLRCVLLSNWESECDRERAVSKAHSSKHRRQRFREAVAELEGAGRITRDSADGQRVYPAPKDRGDEA